MNDDRTMIVTDENGNEIKTFILFTTTLPETNKNYIFYMKEDESGQVYVSEYDENGRLFSVEDDNIWAKLEEVFQSFLEDSCDNDCANCNQECEEKE